MSLGERLAASPVVEIARVALADAGIEAWIAGGAVRDAVRGGEVADLDLAVAGSPEAAAKTIAAASGGHAFELSAEFATWRVADRGKAWQVDATALRGETIEADLA
jgi:tRNA nucleotidyltransferase/poly(A) polymerase